MKENLVQKFASAHPPAFSLEDALRVSEEKFGVSGTPTPLWGERDQNFMICAPDHDGYVLKVSNSLETDANIDFQIRALQHLAIHAPNVDVPDIKPLKDGSFLGHVHGADGDIHIIHMVSLLGGVSLPKTAYQHDVLKAIGKQAGEAALGLRGFFHSAAGQEMFWDIRHIGDYMGFIPYIDDKELRKNIEIFIPVFCSDTLPVLHGLRSQVIHHDTNPTNILVDPNNPRNLMGLIDFGDMIHGPIAQDVAVAAAELITSNQNTLDNISAVVFGYDSALPLEETEIDLMYDLIVARCIQGTLIGVARARSGNVTTSDREYIEMYGPPLEALLTYGRETVRRKLRSICRFPEYCPPTPLPFGSNKDRTNDLIERRHRVLGKTLSLSYDTPVHTVRGEGVWLYDVDGRRYLDCYNNVPHVGHCHPHVVNALSRQAKALNTNTRYVFETAVEYAERLGAMMPGDLGACLYVNSGSEANDLALRMAKTCTGHDGAMIVDGAYHGVTTEIYALSPSNDWWMPEVAGTIHPSETRSDIQTISNPDIVRGPFGTDDPDAGEKYADDAGRAIAALEAADHPVGAFMVDSSFSSHGILDVPDGYTARVVDRVRAAGGMIIGDEVQYGFGRSGDHMWGFQNHGFIPDFVTLGKPIGNGIALGVVVTTPAILEKFTQITDFFSTFGGNPVACAAALAVMDVIEEENLLENCRMTGDYLLRGLRAVSDGRSNIGDVRGKGLFLGVDVVSDPDTMTPDAGERSRIQNHLRDNGFLVGSEGYHGNLLKIRPPLVFKKSHADMFIDAFEQAITAH